MGGQTLGKILGGGNQRHARTVRISQKWEDLHIFLLHGLKELKNLIHKVYVIFFLILI